MMAFDERIFIGACLPRRLHISATEIVNGILLPFRRPKPGTTAHIDSITNSMEKLHDR